MNMQVGSFYIGRLKLNKILKMNREIEEEIEYLLIFNIQFFSNFTFCAFNYTT